MQTANRVKLSVAIVSLLLLAVGVSGAWYVHRLQRTTSQMVSENVNSIIAAEELELQVRAVRYEINQFLISGSESNLREAVHLQPLVEKHRERADRNATTEEERQLINRINAGLDRLFVSLKQLASEPSSPAAREDIGRLVEEILTQGVLLDARRYLDLNEKELRTSDRLNQATSARLAVGLLLLGTCGAVSGLVAGYGVARGISRSILQLSVPVRDVAGQLNEVVGPISVSADASLEELESVLRGVSGQVSSIIERLQESHREVVRADQLAALGQLAAGLAHELRNPLMCMKVLVQSARSGRSGPLEERDLQILDEEITRLAARLQEFLEFARPATLEKKDVDLQRVVAQTIQLFRSRAERRSVGLSYSPACKELVAACDEVQLRQVLLNLLINALDAVPSGGKIEVRAYAESSAGDDPKETLSVVLEVLDNGCGLPEGAGDRIFEPFFSTKDTGLGLGLATCRRIVESHGGEITGNDRTEGGAVFRIVLPRARVRRNGTVAAEQVSTSAT